MKRVFALIVTLVIIFSLFVTVNASGDKTYYPSDVAESGGTVTVTDSEIKDWKMNGYIKFSGVDMTGVKSVSVNGSVRLESDRNGEVYCIRMDGLKSEILGWVKMDETGGVKDFQKMWKDFYDTVAVEGRENERCRMTHMPNTSGSICRSLSDRSYENQTIFAIIILVYFKAMLYN